MKLIVQFLVVVFALQVTVLGRAQEKSDAPNTKKEAVAEKVKPKPELYIETYVVPPTFINVLLPDPEDSKGPSDPFAGPINVKRVSAKEILEAAGIEFPDGASAEFHPEKSMLVVINTEDQLELVDAYTGVDGCALGIEKGIHIILEYIETDSAHFHRWMFENRITTDGTPFRKQVQEWVRNGQASIIETAVVTARSGQRAKSESIHEVIYPTEYDPANIPGELTLSGKDSVPLMTGPLGVAYETRNVGNTVEVDPVLGSDLITIDVNLAPEIVQQKELLNWSPDKENLLTTISMPVFHKLKIATQVTTLHGRYEFLGAAPPLTASDPNRKKPIIFVFVRGDIIKGPQLQGKRRTLFRRK